MKNNKTIKIISTFAIVMIMLCAAPVLEHFGVDFGVKAQAAKSGYFTYTVSYNQATINKVEYYDGGNLTIPDTLGGYPVIKLDSNSFYFCDIDTLTIGKNIGIIYADTFFRSFIKKYKVASNNAYFTSDSSGCLYNADKSIFVRYPTANERTSFSVPDGVDSIYHYAFSHATILNEIELPDSITYIGDGAFSFCLCLQKINIPKNIETINDMAFINCTMLTDLTIPKSCKTIGASAFDSCLCLSEVTIPESVETIGDEAFMNCVMLKKINVNSKDVSIGTNALGKSRILLKNKSGIKQFLENYMFAVLHTLFPVDDSADTYYAKAFTYADSYDKPQSLGVIYCKADSTAELYAINNDVDYDCLHTYKTKTTKATTSKNGKVVKYCTDCGETTSSKTTYKISSIKLSKTSYTYDGKTKKPSVVVKDSKGNTLKKDTDYTVKYASGRKAVGTYKVTVTFKGKYSGSKTLSFKIVLGQVTGIKSAKSGNKTTISWNKVTGATGYVVYEYNKNTGKYTKLGTFKINSIKNTYSGNNAALKIRAYYKAKDGTVHYGAYSSKTTVKI